MFMTLFVCPLMFMCPVLSVLVCFRLCLILIFARLIACRNRDKEECRNSGHNQLENRFFHAI